MSEQGDKRKATMINKYGLEHYEVLKKEWGSKGGKKSPSRLDKQTLERRKEISALGRKALKEKYGI